VTLTELKANPLFADLALLRLPRLSVMPMTAAHWSELEALSKTGLAS
jgi:predicted RNA-binding protein with PUA-like domain